ncbi:MAG TPA: LysR substrate-binding domain-containing protein [Polyangiaceae bacterium]
MDLNEVLVFARVVHAGSFTAAAKELGMPKSTVSRKVSELEERLNARLLQRTTRKLSLTDVGRTYYDYAVRIVGELEEAERAVSSLEEKPRGPLRVTVPSNASYLGPIVSEYLKRYPDVRLELLCTGRTVDLVEERFDVGMRAGTLADSTLIAKSIQSAKWFLVATPGYLKKRGRPRSPDDLKKHDCLLFGVTQGGSVVRLEGAEGTVDVPVSARVLVNEVDVVYEATMAGLGIAVLPAYRCVEDLRAGRLECVLRPWNIPPTPFHVVYPSSRHISAKVKSFVEHLVRRMTPPPWELGPMP